MEGDQGSLDGEFRCSRSRKVGKKESIMSVLSKKLDGSQAWRKRWWSFLGLLLNILDPINGRIILSKQRVMFAEGGRDGGVRTCGWVWVVTLTLTLSVLGGRKLLEDCLFCGHFPVIYCQPGSQHLDSALL